MKAGSYADVRASAHWPVLGTRHEAGGLAITRYDGDALLIHHWETGQAVLLETMPELEAAWAALTRAIQQRRQARSR
jgi:hypothetical protein